ncbi:MAG: glutathione S-transferase family protein, partial [bacterium]
MYTLYWHPSSSSLAPMAVLEELRVPYKLHEVDYDGGETRSPGYMRLQPLGLIPALEIEGGRPMFESAAIILYLCDRHEAEYLAPRHQEEGRQNFLQWLFFFADTLYPSYNRYYHPERYTS